MKTQNKRFWYRIPQSVIDYGLHFLNYWKKKLEENPEESEKWLAKWDKLPEELIKEIEAKNDNAYNFLFKLLKADPDDPEVNLVTILFISLMDAFGGADIKIQLCDEQKK